MKRIIIFLASILLFLPSLVRAMPPGTLLYRTSGEGKMYGYSGDPLVYSEKGIIKSVYSGHAAIYIGQENGIDYIVEALSGGIVKTPAANFVNLAEGEKYLGAKIPRELNAIQQAKVVAIAKSLVGKKLAYDFDFKSQKGPGSGEWTCVGLTEKLYESANISNPNNLESLEYDPNYYAIDITPDGFDNYSVANQKGDCFSREREFSKIARRTDLLIPAPELIGYDLGLENNGDRYIFLPYTQFLQATLSDVTTDITVASSFSGSDVRGSVPTAALVLRWSLINNPLSSLKTVVQKTKEAIVNVSNKIFGSGANVPKTEIVLNDVAQTSSSSKVKTTKIGAVVSKASSKSINDSKNSSEIKTQSRVVTVNKKNTTETKLASTDSAVKNSAQTTIKPTTKSESNSVKKVAASKTTNTKTTNSTKTSSSTVSAYYNPVIAKPVVTGGGGGSSSSAPADNTPKIATINKIYSTGENNFVELYNPGDKDFDLASANYRLEKTKTAEDPSLIMRVGNSEDGAYPGGTIIKAHSSYLIVKSTANAYYLSRAQAIATRDEFKWPGKAYTIYLGTGAISSSTDSDIIEAVGFGTDATYYQGSGPATEIIDNHILSRIKNTNNNKVDFVLIKSDDPSIDWAALEAALATSTEEISTSTEKIATSTENISSSTEEFATSTEDLATSTNSQTSSSTIVASSSNSEEIDWSKIALINKIYSTGTNEWVELFNPGTVDFDLVSANYRLEKTKTAEDPSLIMRIGNSEDGFYPGGTIIKAGGRYLIVRDDANPFFRAKANAIATRTDFSWGSTGYTLYLGNGPISSSSDLNIVDLVGYGEDATYWLGNGPATAITNNYVLNRIATTSNNNSDFNLIKSDDPGIDWAAEENNLATTTSIYSFSASAYDLFPEKEPINSSGLNNLWHFDECSSTTVKSAFGGTDLITEDHWAAGKFACAKEAGYEYGKISGTLSNPLDVNNFSLSFWFRATMTYPRLSFNLSNSDGDSINITLEDGLMQFSGLPNPDWRYYREFPFNNVWRQATLVVNRNEGYWSLYIDGVEKFHQDSYKMLAPMDTIEITGNNGPYALDELAIWNRSLSPAEVFSIREAEAPFNPVVLGASQKIPILKHYWNFNEGIGTSSADLIGQANLPINKNAWSNLDLTNSALNNNWDRKIQVNFPVLKSPDLSLTFWWRSLDNYNANRVRVALQNTTANNILTLIPSPYVSGYDFNNFYSYFSYGENLTIPHDLNWHLLALVYDSYRNILKFYVDGALKGSREFIWSANRPLANGLEIVSEQGNTDIDNLGVWEGALSAGQIQEIFTNN